MKKFILIFFFARHSLKLLATAGVFIFSFSLCEAQVDTLVYRNEATQSYDVTSKKPNVGYININAGIGYSLITLALPNGLNLGSDGSYNILSVSPSYNFTIDYNITNKFGFGLCGDYQDIVDNPASEGSIFTNQTERITRYNVAIRLIMHTSKKPKNDAYYGARVGLSFGLISSYLLVHFIQDSILPHLCLLFLQDQVIRYFSGIAGF